jgi:colanic acid/amylovoran biosynthesis glycosyltransferase
LKVVEAFDTYLRTTENWCYKLLKHLSGVDLIVISEYRENESTFPLSGARFTTAFRSRFRQDHSWLIQKLINRFQKITGWIWKKTLVFQIADADVVHAHFSVVAWDYLWLTRITRTPLVVSFYGFDYEYLPNAEPSWRKRYRKLFKHGALFIAEGNAGRSRLLQMGCPEHKAQVVHLGIEVDRIPFYRRPKKKFELKLVQVARFTDKKGHETTFNAFSKASILCPELTLTFVGKDPQGIRARLEALAAEQGLDGQVQFIDSIDYALLHGFLQDYHVFIHPSRYGKHRDSEGGAPIVLLDAQATGMPVLATYHCDIPEEVIDGETGILVDENAVDDLAIAIQRFYEMEEIEYQAYGRRARAHVGRHYQAAHCATELKKKYEMLVQTRNRARIGTQYEERH